MNLYKRFNDVINSLNKHKVDYILIGGYAVILYGFPRLTQDVDLILKMDEDNISKFRTALNSVFNDSNIREITFDELKKYAVVRYGTAEGFFIDVMAGIAEVADYDNIASTIIDVDGLEIKIATPEALFELKRNTLRPEDKRDALFLKKLIDSRK